MCFLLTDYFLQKYCKQYGRELRADRSIYQLFVAYGWPGNVRGTEECRRKRCGIVRDRYDNGSRST